MPSLLVLLLLGNAQNEEILVQHGVRWTVSLLELKCLHGLVKQKLFWYLETYYDELAHHLEFVYRGRKDPSDLLDALYLQEDGKDMSKAQRKLIYEPIKPLVLIGN